MSANSTLEEGPAVFFTPNEKKQIRELIRKEKLDHFPVMRTWRTYFKRNIQLYGSTELQRGLCEETAEMRAINAVAFIQSLLSKKASLKARKHRTPV